MSATVTTIGAFEAKTKFSELLARVADAGAEFVITKHDRPIARLVPAVKPRSHEEAAKAVARGGANGNGAGLEETRLRTSSAKGVDDSGIRFGWLVDDGLVL